MKYGRFIQETIVVNGKQAVLPKCFQERIAVQSVQEAQSHFNDLLKRFSEGEVTDPGLKIETWKDSNKPKQAILTWSER